MRGSEIVKKPLTPVLERLRTATKDRFGRLAQLRPRG
jgi:hypothetical protein